MRLIRVRLVLVNLNPINDTYIGEKDDYDSENSWISDGLPSSSRRGKRRWEVGGGRVEREVKYKRDRR